MDEQPVILYVVILVQIQAIVQPKMDNFIVIDIPDQFDPKSLPINNKDCIIVIEDDDEEEEVRLSSFCLRKFLGFFNRFFNRFHKIGLKKSD